MSAILDCALTLAQQKVRFFQVRPNTKLPAIADYPRKATCDPHTLTEWFGGKSEYNSGIACGKIAEGLYLVGFDIDYKDGRNGYDTLELMAELGEEFPKTWAQRTPSGGEHRLFFSPVPIRQGTNVPGAGIDFRSDGGYLLGPESQINGIPYRIISDLPIARFPDFAIRKWEKKGTLHLLGQAKTAGKPVEDQVTALRASVEFLAKQQKAKQGERSNECFRVCCRLRDFGLDQTQVLAVLLDHWKCEPMLDESELLFTIGNAYRYARGAQGSAAPENIFTPVAESAPPPTPLEKTPIELMNENHFYYAANGISRVCWETTKDGKFHLERFPVPIFHEKYLSKTMLRDGATVNVTKAWMESDKRREYDRMRFCPAGGGEIRPNEYNTWRGFAVEPVAAIGGEGTNVFAHEAVKLFLEHIEQNICGGDLKLSHWLVGFMAHIFQHPGEKPEVSVVFQGKKSTGKTIVSEILDHLIGDNSIILANRNHALGHFNSLMEDKLLVTLDEAFWSGDKDVEGILKHIITGTTRVITYKGAEPYPVRVFDRIIIISNEDWVIPATADERRFAMFKLGEGRQQDRAFFGDMKKGLFKFGGDRLLLRYLLDYPLDGVDVNSAPHTPALDDQKMLTLNVFAQWWVRCLAEGQLLGSGLSEWPETISTKDLYSAFTIQIRSDGYKSYIPSNVHAGRMFKAAAPQSGGSRVHTGNVRLYHFLPLEEARKEWEASHGFKGDW